MWNKGSQNRLSLGDLHKRLYSVMPELQPISTHKWGECGTWKAIDGEGTVYEVEINYVDDIMHRRERKVMDYAVLRSQSVDALETGRFKPHEGWDI